MLKPNQSSPRSRVETIVSESDGFRVEARCESTVLEAPASRRPPGGRAVGALIQIKTTSADREQTVEFTLSELMSVQRAVSRVLPRERSRYLARPYLGIDDLTDDLADDLADDPD